MSEATEIYLCRAGQSLKQGKIEYSDQISTREDAAADAVERCRFNKFYAKIAYYAISENGDFKCIFTYNNPNFSAPGEAEEKQEEKPKEPVKKPSLITRLVDSVTGSSKKTKKNKKKKKTKSKKSKTA